MIAALLDFGRGDSSGYVARALFGIVIWLKNQVWVVASSSVIDNHSDAK